MESAYSGSLDLRLLSGVWFLRIVKGQRDYHQICEPFTTPAAIIVLNITPRSRHSGVPQQSILL